jgi:hypothetical protein
MRNTTARFAGKKSSSDERPGVMPITLMAFVDHRTADRRAELTLQLPAPAKERAAVMPVSLPIRPR